MKTKILFSLLAVMLLAGCSGCSTTSLVQDLDEFDKLNISEVEVAGKFSHTVYKRSGAVSTLEHTNAWLPKVKIVRDRNQSLPEATK